MATVKQALTTVTRRARGLGAAETKLRGAREALRVAPTKAVTAARLEALRARVAAASTSVQGERANRDQAIRAARDAGATVKQIAAAAEASETTLRNVLSRGALGPSGTDAALASEDAP